MRITNVLACILLAGCSVSTPKISEPHTCKNSGYVKIIIIKPDKNDLRIQDEDIIKNLAKRCIIQDVDSKASLQISFDSYVKTTTQEKTLSSSTQVNANIKMKGTLVNDAKSAFLRAGATSTIDSEQILGFGQSAIVTNADRLQLLKSVIKTLAQQALDALDGDASQKSAPKSKRDMDSHKDIQKENKIYKKDERSKSNQDSNEDASSSVDSEEPNAPIDGDTF